MKTLIVGLVLTLAAVSAHAATPTSITCDFQKQLISMSGAFEDGKLRLVYLRDVNSAHSEGEYAEEDLEDVDPVAATKSATGLSYQFDLGNENWQHTYILDIQNAQVGDVKASIDFEYGDEYGVTESVTLDGTCTLK